MLLFRIQALLILAVVAVAAGCRQPTLAERDELERNDPAIQAAWAASQTGSLEVAEAHYDAIIIKRPDLARAHLDQAMLLMTADEKPLKAIYHFMRYLELRPDTERKELIGRNVRLLTAMLTSKVTRSRISQLEQQVAILQVENQALRLGVQPAPLRPASPGTVLPALVVPPLSVPAPAVGPAPAPPARPRTYTVQSGDSLTRIAQKLYGDGAKGDRIYQANRGKLKSMNALKEGQVLVIPP
jgi:tetratricopeptide (TPR) repeat protein